MEVTLGGNLEPGEKTAITLQGGGTLAATGPADLQCQSTGLGSVLNPSVTAVQVATLTNS